MRENAWKCDNCKKEIMGTFDPDWIHFKHILFAKGVYSEERDFQNYRNYGNLTFCSMNCLIAFLHSEIRKITGDSGLNPSSRVAEDAN